MSNAELKIAAEDEVVEVEAGDVVVEATDEEQPVELAVTEIVDDTEEPMMEIVDDAEAADEEQDEKEEETTITEAPAMAA